MLLLLVAAAAADTDGNFITMHVLVQVVDLSKINFQKVVGTEQVYRGIRDCFSKILKESGIRGLYRGVGMTFNASLLYHLECVSFTILYFL